MSAHWDHRMQIDKTLRMRNHVAQSDRSRRRIQARPAAVALLLGITQLSACASILGIDDLHQAQGDASVADGASADSGVDAASTDGSPKDAAEPTHPGSFALEPHALHIPRDQLAAVLVGDRLYVLGGITCQSCAGSPDVNGTTASVEVASVSSSGIDAFADAPRMINARADFAAFRVSRGSGDWLYAVGGLNRPTGQTVGNYITEIERAPIAADNTIGSFSVVAGITLDTGRAGAGLVVTPDAVYLIGGRVGQNSYSTLVSKAQIDANGNLSSFQPDANAGAAQAPRWRAASVQSANGVYMLGGEAAAATTTIDAGALTGSVLTGLVQVTVSLATPRSGAAALPLGGRIWVFGGGAPGAGAYSTIESAPLASSLGAFAPESLSLDTARSLAAGVRLPTEYCLIGGSANHSDTSILDTVSCAPLL
ncbi:MAG: hypothetical protein K8W52_21750 [Deltaproteobacteria bacterium]|nr:hypothetical protein [Deltaproteobacteria bacterium]